METKKPPANGSFARRFFRNVKVGIDSVLMGDKRSAKHLVGKRLSLDATLSTRVENETADALAAESNRPKGSGKWTKMLLRCDRLDQFNENGPFVESPTTKNRQSHLQTVCNLEHGIARKIASFLTLKEVASVAECSWGMLRSLEGCPIRLDMNSTAYSTDELCELFRNEMCSWRVTGVRVRSPLTAAFWKTIYQNGMIRLIVVGTIERFDARELTKCKEIMTFDGGISCRRIDNLEAMLCSTKLRYLYLRGTENIVNLRTFLPGNNLRELSLYMCSNLVSLEGMEQCKYLRVVDLGGCKKIRDLDALAECKELEMVSVADCSNLESIHGLKNHPTLHHLDLTGCVGIENDFSVLDSIPNLNAIRLKRCRPYAICPLVGSPNRSVHKEATNILNASGYTHATTVLPRLVSLFEEGINNTTTALNILVVIEMFSKHEIASSESQLVPGGVLPVLFSLCKREEDDQRILEKAMETIAKMSQNSHSCEAMVAEGVIALIAKIVYKCLSQNNPKMRAATLEHCASTFLFIGAIESLRWAIVEQGGIRCLIDLLRFGQAHDIEVAAEAAGAIWNLAASFDIGRKLVEAGVVPILISVLEEGTMTGKIQATGALRNLAILSANKKILFEHGVVKRLLDLVKIGAKKSPADRSQDDISLLTKAVATLRILATNGDIQLSIGMEPGAIEVLVLLLNSPDLSLGRQACGALLALSFEEQNRLPILHAGGIPELVRILDEDESELGVTASAGCLWNLTMNDVVEQAIVEAGAIPALVKRLSSENIDIVCRVAGALRGLAYQEKHKELIVKEGGIEKLVSHLNQSGSKAVTHAIAALRLIASGSCEARAQIVGAGGIQCLVDLIRLADKDTLYLALSTLAHLAAGHANVIAAFINITELVQLREAASGSSLIAEDATYILQRIAVCCSGDPKLLGIVESERVAKSRELNEIVLSRVRGVPGDTRITLVPGEHSYVVDFFSYSSVATETVCLKGKVYYEIEFLALSDSPTFGWVTNKFQRNINYLSDYGIGYPAQLGLSQASWAIDGVNQRRWPGKEAYGHAWKVGDVLTVAADLDNGSISFGLNGDFSGPMGVAFDNLGAICLSPAMSASAGSRIKVRFSSMKYPPPGVGYSVISKKS
mmetsp:Transcript_11925/g.21958  ORF Transcript_11925/g.21958 Transcript_11925/m.21958 type:complete len:1127 (+) Transcript_11925:4869-8249(+)